MARKNAKKNPRGCTGSLRKSTVSFLTAVAAIKRYWHDMGGALGFCLKGISIFEVR